jgi:hypothetical protein
MPFEKLTSFTKDVSDLADQPSLGSAAALKAHFDAAPEEVRQYLNKLIDSLQSQSAGDSGAQHIGSAPINGLNGITVWQQLGSVLEWVRSYGLGGNAKELVGDFNAVSVTGHYKFAAGSGNAPNNYGYFFLDHHEWQLGDSWQMACELGTGNLYSRTQNNGVWKPWKQVSLI